MSIAERLGVDRGTVTRWLKGDRKGTHTPIEKLVRYMRALGMRPGEFLGDDAEYEGFLQIPWLKATASMGGGSYEGEKDVESHLSFQTSWLMSKGAPSRMVVINASGGSMEPTIPDGSVVLIDESKNSDLVNGKIYFVCYGEHIFLKRLKVGKDGRVVALQSDRGDPDIPVQPGDYFEVIGQAVWYGKDLS